MSGMKAVSYWEDPCDICGENAITATRGIPQRRTCAKGHNWIRCCPAPSKDEPAVPVTIDPKEQKEHALHKLCLAMIGSCKCVTKTNDWRFHNEICTYRLLNEAAEAIKKIP